MNMNTQQKVVAALGACAVGALVASYLYRRQAQTTNESNKVSNEAKKPVNDENYAKAQQLKDDGNRAFKVGDYDEAIKLYTEALSLTNVDSHLFYSNRSAAYLVLNKIQEALEDGKKCIEINATWSKGYFRTGRAYFALDRYDDAYITFYQGLLIDPKSDELKKCLDQTKDRLAPLSDMDPRAVADLKITQLYFQRLNELICSSALHTTYDEVRKRIELSLSLNGGSNLLDDELISKCMLENDVETLRVITQTLLEENNGDLAIEFAQQAVNKAPENPDALLLLTTALIRSSKPDYSKTLETVRRAFQLKPNDTLIAHTYASIMLRLYPLLGREVNVDLRQVLGELKLGLENNNTNHLLIADAGIRLWFKFFEDPTLQTELMLEEQRSMQLGIPMHEAYLEGLAKGGFSKLCLEPFFLQALSQVVFNNIGLERVLTPFRSALIHLKADSKFNSVAPFVYSLALQSYRNNYSWPLSPEDKEELSVIKSQVTKTLNSEEVSSLVVDGSLNQDLLVKISILSLFYPLFTIPHLAPIVSAVDLTKYHPFLAKLLRKTVLEPQQEEEILSSLSPVTPLPSSSASTFYDGHLTSLWDNAGILDGRLTKVSVSQELKWLYPEFKADSFDSSKVDRVLIAGCGSGLEVYQTYRIYENVHVTGLDFSPKNLSYAIRQTRDLGIADAQFVLGDIFKISPAMFSGGLFDVVVANTTLSVLQDPFKAWERLGGLLRKGGVMKISLYSRHYIDLLVAARKFLRDQISPPLFDTQQPLPRVTRQPTMEEISLARQIIFDTEESNGLTELLMTPQSYPLNEFTDLLFQPHVVGFSFKAIGDCIHRLGLELIGFEFPNVQQETILAYRAEHPSDPRLRDCDLLEVFDSKHPEAFKSQVISFTCQKALE